MRLMLFSKLFLAVLVSVLVVMLIMLAFVNWRFRSGYMEYLHGEENQQLETLATRLADYHRTHGGWNDFKRQPRDWRQLLDRMELQIELPSGKNTRPNALPGMRQGARHGTRDGMPPDRVRQRAQVAEVERRQEGGSTGQSDRRGSLEEQSTPHPSRQRPGYGAPADRSGNRPGKRLNNGPGSHLRLVLLDADDHFVIGNRQLRQRWLNEGAEHALPRSLEKREAILYEQDIRLNGNRIGRVLVLRKQGENELWAAAFLQQQLESLYVPTVVAGLMAFLIAALMVRHVLRPVRLLTEGTQTMMSGTLDQPVAVVTQDELGQLTEQFNAMAASLAEQRDMRQQWQTDIAHELRTPVAALRAEIEALLDGVRRPSRDRLQSLHRSVMALGSLVDDLHQLSATDAGAWEHRPQTLDLAEILDDVTFALESQFLQKNLTLDIQPGDQPLVIQGDGMRLYQLFSNLLANSLRYTDAPGVVMVSGQTLEDTVEIRIQDTKPGVGDRDLPKLFDRLYRVDRSRSRVLGGSGLGLSIGKAIVETHSGTIRAEHSPMGGLTVVMAFPRAVE